MTDSSQAVISSLTAYAPQLLGSAQLLNPEQSMVLQLHRKWTQYHTSQLRGDVKKKKKQRKMNQDFLSEGQRALCWATALSLGHSLTGVGKHPWSRASTLPRPWRARKVQLPSGKGG